MAPEESCEQPTTTAPTGQERGDLGSGDVDSIVFGLKASMCPPSLPVFLSLKARQQLQREISMQRLRGQAEFL